MTKLVALLYGLFSITTLIVTTIIAFIPILFIGFFKLIPNRTWQVFCTTLIDKLVMSWCDVNNLYVDKVQNLKLEVTGLDHLPRNHWYLVVANHQSWLDVVILHRLFNRKIPVLKFFIKDQLKWVPLLGFSWWAMGCLFMKRYSKEYLARKPHKKGQDLTATLKAINLFKQTPASIMNFLEGTRFTPQKKQLQNSPYTHLLKPKAGGIGFIIGAMGQQITTILDVTIVYGQKNHSLWDFLCKRVTSAKILIRQIPIPTHFRSNLLIEDKHIQTQFKEWLNQQWAEKDKLIASLQP
jgi:1-acyl-sn-glycerol-3-phosphate acyltransferase